LSEIYSSGENIAGVLRYQPENRTSVLMVFCKSWDVLNGGKNAVCAGSEGGTVAGTSVATMEVFQILF